MFFISPIKTLYSIKFYLQTLKESLGKAFGFVAYLFVLGSIFLILYTPGKLKPLLAEGVEKVADYVPNIKISQGIITANDNKRLVISPKELEGYKIIFDTASTEPAYPTQMQKENILMYVNKNTVYVFANGQFQQNTVQKEKDFDMEISKEILMTKKEQIVQTLATVLVIIFILTLALHITFFIIIALLVAFIINAVTKANLSFKELLTLALYLQGPVFLIELILFLLPTKIIGLSIWAALLVFVIYLNLIFLNLRATYAGKKTEVPFEEDDD